MKFHSLELREWLDAILFVTTHRNNIGCIVQRTIQIQTCFSEFCKNIKCFWTCFLVVSFVSSLSLNKKCLEQPVATQLRNEPYEASTCSKEILDKEGRINREHYQKIFNTILRLGHKMIEIEAVLCRFAKR